MNEFITPVIHKTTIVPFIKLKDKVVDIKENIDTTKLLDDLQNGELSLPQLIFDGKNYSCNDSFSLLIALFNDNKFCLNLLNGSLLVVEPDKEYDPVYYYNESFSNLISTRYCIRNKTKWLSFGIKEQSIDFLSSFLSYILDLPCAFIEK